VLNARFEVLHPMLDVLRDHQNTEHRFVSDSHPPVVRHITRTHLVFDP